MPAVFCRPVSDGEVVMNLDMFYRGFLYALRERVTDGAPRFEAEGERFHEAFRSALEYAQSELPEVPAAEILENFDPVFGVSPEATEMLLEGERDFILSMLNPRLRVAQFKISRQSAKHELDQLPAREAFRELAARFHAQLESSG
ncbi:MAG: hypothetical protein JWP97_6207 [Labilithrix sp.]|nr:hypothetical protein [Labilithrix sp.]